MKCEAYRSHNWVVLLNWDILCRFHNEICNSWFQAHKTRHACWTSRGGSGDRLQQSPRLPSSPHRPEREGRASKWKLRTSRVLSKVVSIKSFIEITVFTTVGYLLCFCFPDTVLHKHGDYPELWNVSSCPWLWDIGSAVQVRFHACRGFLPPFE